MPLLCLLLLGLVTTAAIGEPLKIAVAGFVSADNPQIQAVAQGTAERIFRLLNQLDGVHAEQLAEFDPATNPVAYQQYAAILLGHFDFGDNRTIEVELSIYRPAEQGISQRYGQEVYSVFELFAAAEQASSQLLQGLVGREITTGRLRFAGRGADEHYSVLLNGNKLGIDLREQVVLAGEYRVEVQQHAGRERITVYREQRLVEPDAVALVEFALLAEATPPRRLAGQLGVGNMNWPRLGGYSLRGGLQLLLEPWSVGLTGRGYLSEQEKLPFNNFGAVLQAGRSFEPGNRLRLVPQLGLGGALQQMGSEEMDDYLKLVLLAIAELQLEFITSSRLQPGLSLGYQLFWGEMILSGISAELTLGWRF